MDEKRTPIEYLSAEELEQLLRREGETMPEEELLQLLEELDGRRTTSFDADAAWQRFQTDYLADTEELRPNRSWHRGLAVAAAVLVLVVGLSVTAGAIGGRNLWQTVASWTEDAFVLSGVEPTAPEEQPEVYDTFREEVYAQTGISGLAPSYIPEGFELAEMEREELTERFVLHASYLRGEQYIRLDVRTWLPDDATHVEKDDTPVELYTEMGVDCYITQNLDRLTAIWVKDGYQCIISGDLTREELMKMLDSVS